ncbi:hypothetical protein [Clostridium sp.]|uniref:hypothetical protein n=1 Tax=Clostridium sp. TaxID=1506 RepID=UPI003994B16C
MSYVKTKWKDKIINEVGEIIQEGTPLSAENLNNIEAGIEENTEQLFNIEKNVNDKITEFEKSNKEIIDNLKTDFENITSNLKFRIEPILVDTKESSLKKFVIDNIPEKSIYIFSASGSNSGDTLTIKINGEVVKVDKNSSNTTKCFSIKAFILNNDVYIYFKRSTTTVTAYPGYLGQSWGFTDTFTLTSNTISSIEVNFNSSLSSTGTLYNVSLLGI